VWLALVWQSSDRLNSRMFRQFYIAICCSFASWTVVIPILEKTLENFQSRLKEIKESAEVLNTYIESLVVYRHYAVMSINSSLQV
jgi:hypothetical protein